jgi:hypothetical protein
MLPLERHARALEAALAAGEGTSALTPLLAAMSAALDVAVQAAQATLLPTR